MRSLLATTQPVEKFVFGSGFDAAPLSESSQPSIAVTGDPDLGPGVVGLIPRGRMTTMRRKRHIPEQAVRKLREGERRLNAGEDLGSVLRHLEITESTWNRWRSTYGGMKAADVKELKELRVENTRFKKLLAEAELDKAELDKAMLKDLAEGKW